MKLGEIIDQVDPRWRKDFETFIETGEGSDEFLAFLDHNPQGQQALEMAFNAQAEAFRGLAEEFKNTSPPEILPEPAAVQEPAIASQNLTQAVEELVRLPQDQRIQAVRQAASSLGSSLHGDQQQTAYHVVQSLQSELLARE
jgi:hypothetical protein